MKHLIYNQCYLSSGCLYSEILNCTQNAKSWTNADPPPKGLKGGSGESSTTFLYLCRISMAQLIDWLGDYLTANHLALRATTFTDLLTYNTFNYRNPASSFKGIAFSRLVSNMYFMEKRYTRFFQTPFPLWIPITIIWCPYYCLSNKTKAKSSAFHCRGSTRIINNYHLVYSSIAYNGRMNPNATPPLLVKLALYALTCYWPYKVISGMGELGENRKLCYECVVAHIYYISPCLF